MNVVSHIKYSRINQELVIIVIVNIIQPNPGEEALIYDSLTLPALYAIRNELETRSRETTQRDKKGTQKQPRKVKSEKGKGMQLPSHKVVKTNRPISKSHPIIDYQKRKKWP